ncbi:hypothetical protein EYF80_041349 [Liparis tanakae]|uniref:Uncharacterized protein n=1 Tax=Liparis tanakae TaxID=230148 RepID=A0A4Z2G6B3_9TELE|nr:hypothetical protein EYF80_041349 [Liparis tanakae]
MGGGRGAEGEEEERWRSGLLTLSCFSLWPSCAFSRSTSCFMALLGERSLASVWAASAARSSPAASSARAARRSSSSAWAARAASRAAWRSSSLQRPTGVTSASIAVATLWRSSSAVASLSLWEAASSDSSCSASVCCSSANRCSCWAAAADGGRMAGFLISSWTKKGEHLNAAGLRDTQTQRHTHRDTHTKRRERVRSGPWARTPGPERTMAVCLKRSREESVCRSSLWCSALSSSWCLWISSSWSCSAILARSASLSTPPASSSLSCCSTCCASTTTWGAPGVLQHAGGVLRPLPLVQLLHLQSGEAPGGGRHLLIGQRLACLEEGGAMRPAARLQQQQRPVAPRELRVLPVGGLQRGKGHAAVQGLLQRRHPIGRYVLQRENPLTKHLTSAPVLWVTAASTRLLSSLSVAFSERRRRSLSSRAAWRRLSLASFTFSSVTERRASPRRRRASSGSSCSAASSSWATRQRSASTTGERCIPPPPPQKLKLSRVSVSILN